MTSDEQALFAAALSALVGRYRAHESERAAAQSPAESDAWGRRMACVRSAIDGLRDPQSEIEAEGRRLRLL